MVCSVKTIEDQKFVIKVNGQRATVEIADEFRNQLVTHVENGKVAAIVDLNEAEFIDSAFLGALVTGLKRAAAKGGEIKLVGLQQPVRAMFELTRLDNIFDIHETTETALESF